MNEYFQALLQVIKNHVKLFGLEARLAKRSLIPFCVSLISLIIVSMTTWLLLLFLVGYVAYVSKQNLIFSVGLVFIVNMIAMLVLIAITVMLFHRILFRKTRAHLGFYRGQFSNGQLDTTDKRS